MFASVLQIAKFAPRVPHNPANFAIRTLVRPFAHLERFPGFAEAPVDLFQGQQPRLGVDVLDDRGRVDGRRPQRLLRRPAHGHARGERGVEGISGARRAGDLGLQHRAVQDRLRGAHERPLAAVRHHHVAGTELAQAGEEIDHAHLAARRR